MANPGDKPHQVTGNVLRRRVALLVVLLCLLILYAEWSRIHGSIVVLSFAGKHVVESSRPETAAAAATGGGGGGGSGSGAGNRQSLIGAIKSINSEAAAIMQQLVARKAGSRDPELIDVVRRMMNPAPTEGPIVLSGEAVYETAQSTVVDALLNKQRDGFFIDCGAYDGETISNTLPFEHNRGWTGILIEVNPYYYVQMLGRNRKVWTLNACLSPYGYATQLEFQTHFHGQLGRVKLTDDDLKNLSSSGDWKKDNLEVVPCFPLETILLALNRTHVDYFSLDVEGVELEVLKTIPFDRIDIHVLTVEYAHGRSGKEAYKSFMESKGFKTLREVTGQHAIDYLFIKQ